MTVTLTPGATGLAAFEAIWRDGSAAALDRAARPAVEAAAGRIAAAAAGSAAVYGVNTGFGKLASVAIAAADTARLQRNLILSHCAGVGEPTPRAVVRLMMALKLVSLGRGASGVRWEVVELIEGMLARGVTPLVPAQGSVGASGDLAPLAHMAAVMLGEGEAEVGERVMPGGEALAAAGLAPVTLAAKEGLALINGTQFSTAHALAGVFGAWRAAQNALIVSAMSTDAIMGSTAPLRAEIHALRGHRGQIEAAEVMRAIMAGSAIRESHREGDTRVQDPYCIRCQPQVTGAAMDLLRQVAATLETEANAATDNPLVLADAIVSGGNFHAEPVAFAADIVALAVAEIGAIAQRRVALMVDPTLSYDLPPFLTAEPGLNSGFMIAEVTSAALMSENKQLATPCSTELDADERQPGGPRLDGGARGAAAGADGGEPRAHPRHRGALRGAGDRVPGAVADQCAVAGDARPAAGGGAGAGGGPLPRARPRGGRGAGAGRVAARCLGGGVPGASAMTPVEVSRGDGPVVLGLPHTGTWLPEEVRPRLNDTGLALADTDWHVDRLYEGLLPGVTTVRATFHRYLIDANRAPDDASLYPGQNTTGLCPTTDFDGRPIWRDGAAPDATEVAERVASFHAPYHAALAAEIERVRARHGVAILYDAPFDPRARSRSCSTAGCPTSTSAPTRGRAAPRRSSAWSCMASATPSATLGC